MSNKQNTDRYRAPALDKGLDILELLAKQPGGMTRAEIVSSMGRSPSEIYRMIERLVAREYVTRSHGGDRYALSLKLFLLGSAHPPLYRLTSYAQPLMDEFANKTLQSLHLAVPQAGSAIVVAQASGPANWEFRLRVGAELDLLNTGSGKILIAFQNAMGLEKLFPMMDEIPSEIGIKSKSKLREELDVIKRQGFRIFKSGQLVGVTDISVPIIGTDGNALGVLTCPFIERVDPEPDQKIRKTIDETKALLLELASNISIN